MANPTWSDPVPVPLSTNPDKPDVWGGQRNGEMLELSERTKWLRGGLETVQKTVLTGSGIPEGVVTASPGALYSDAAVTRGAALWRKNSGTGNTGWVVSDGATGWRSIPLSAEWGGSGGSVRVLREESTVTLAANGLIMPASGIVIALIDLGFRTAIGVPNILGRNSSSGAINAITCSTANIAWGGPLVAGNTLNFHGSYITNDPWPTTLPGTPA